MEDAQSISSVLSLSYNAPSVMENLPSAAPASRPFQHAVMGPVVTPGSHRASLLSASERPLGRARRVPIEEKRKEEVELARKHREEEDHECEACRQCLREKEKENWAGGTDLHVKGECNQLYFFRDTSIHAADTCFFCVLFRSPRVRLTSPIARSHSI